jgi:hypothetical protein
MAAAEIDRAAPSLQEEVSLCTWRVHVTRSAPGPALSRDEVAERAGLLLSLPSAVVTRRRKGGETTDDIRPSIVDVRVMGGESEGVWLEADLAARPRGIRPSELLCAMGTDLDERFVRRLHQWILRDGARWEPLPALNPCGTSAPGPTAATAAPHALERAS